MKTNLLSLQEIIYWKYRSRYIKICILIYIKNTQNSVQLKNTGPDNLPNPHFPKYS